MKEKDNEAWEVNRVNYMVVILVGILEHDNRT